MSYAKTSPLRQCVVCRQRLSAASLVQLKAVPLGQAAEGPLQATPSALLGERGRRGRSGYVCIARACLQAIAQKHVCSGFKQGMQVNRQALTETLHTLAQERILMYLGLARCQGRLVHGVERVTERFAAGAGTAVAGEVAKDTVALFVATDLAARSRRQLPQDAVFVPREILGQATGLPGVGAVAILPGRLSLQAAYWFRVWYETRTK